VLVALGVVHFQRHQRLAADTLLGIAAHGALALGLVLLSLSRSITVDINHYLFGDILAVNNADIARIWLCALAVLAAVKYQWRDLLRVTQHPDIAQVEGVNVQRTRLVLMLIIAVVVAVSIKIVGMLLITSLLIIPAATARSFARTPTQMALIASLAGIIAVTGGLSASALLDTPSDASVILAALALFFAACMVKKLMKSI
jgi:zinc transport system permease protein